MSFWKYEWRNSARLDRRGMRRVWSRGMTLVELLMVVTIIVVLMAVSVPAMRPAIRESRLREASRQLNVFFARAKARAAELGRPVSVWIERPVAGSNAGVDLYLAEAPPDYSGDIQGGRCVLYYDPPAQVWRLRFEAATCPSLVAPQGTGLVGLGEYFRIRFSQRGAWYNGRRLTNGDFVLLPPAILKRTGAAFPPADNFVPPVGFFDPGNDGQWGAANVDDDGNGLFDDIREAGTPGTDDNLNPANLFTTAPLDTVGASFELQLAPRRVNSSLLQLPERTAVDLGFSGMGISLPTNWTTATNRYSGREFDVHNSPSGVTAANNRTPVLITLAPSGEIESIGYANQIWEPTGPIHLLIGSFDKLMNADGTTASNSPIPWSTVDTAQNYLPRDFTPSNITDHANIWVSVGDRSGTVTTAENGWELWGSPANFYESFRLSREYAQKAQTMGGR